VLDITFVSKTDNVCAFLLLQDAGWCFARERAYFEEGGKEKRKARYARVVCIRGEGVGNERIRVDGWKGWLRWCSGAVKRTVWKEYSRQIWVYIHVFYFLNFTMPAWTPPYATYSDAIPSYIHQHKR
jgi:hypothetical protein